MGGIEGADGGAAPMSRPAARKNLGSKHVHDNRVESLRLSHRPCGLPDPAHRCFPAAKRSVTAISLERKLRERSATVAVVGLGYAGLPMAVELAWAGFRVVG